VAHLLTHDEKITANRSLGVAIGFFGVVILIGPDSLKGLGADVLAQVAVLAAAVFYAFAGVYGRRFKLMGIDPILTATGQVTASAIVLFPAALLVDHPWTLTTPALPVWEAIVGSAMLSTALGYVLYFRILATAGATNLLLVTFLIPVSAIIMGTFGLGERLDARHFAGLAFIGAGLAAIDGRLLALFRRPGAYREDLMMRDCIDPAKGICEAPCRRGPPSDRQAVPPTEMRSWESRFARDRDWDAG
jgi:drug/metabolite transporter (DMT)-like permease